MKASGISKCVKKKWNGTSTIEQKSLPSNISRSSTVQVDEEIHFIVDSNGLNYSSSLPSEKSLELSRRTYSKKNPIVFPVSQERAGTCGTGLSLKSKHQLSLSISADKTLERKRKRGFDLLNPQNSTPKKLQKRNSQPKIKNTPQTCPPKIQKQRCKSSPVQCDSDSDIEIVAVKVFKPITLPVKSLSDPFKKFSFAQNSLNDSKKKSKYFVPEVNMNEVLINEADIAPTMPSAPDAFPDAREASNSLRWLSANGMISVPSFNSRNLTENGRQPVKNTDQLSTSLPETKTVQEKICKGRRELKSLYDNLDEIVWAKEKSFKNLLRNPDYIRHSERSKSKMLTAGKNLRKNRTTVGNKAQPLQVKKGSAVSALARKKSQMARLNQKLKAKAIARNRISPITNVTKNKVLKKQVILTKDKKKVTLKKVFEEDVDVLYKLNPNPPKPKLALPKTKVGSSKTKSNIPKTKFEKPKIKMENGSKPKMDVPAKSKCNTMKTKPEGPKSKSSTFKLKSENQKAKPDVTKLKSYISTMKKHDSPPSTSGLQKFTYNNKNLPESAHSNHLDSPEMQHLFNNFDKPLYFPKKYRRVSGYMTQQEDFYSAFKKGSKLRVRLQPLEHTNFWNNDCYEEMRKRYLEQAYLKASSHRKEENNVMYQEILDSLLNAQSATNSNNKVMKKKKPEEETLRSSVRQSEGAFRYKEIVVKKHPNYMQVVLVPCGGKQNTLTLDAMREIREAFLLAKKDPNCRAVLLNSGGTYFCSGIDLRPLVGNNKRQAAEELSNSIRDLVLTLGVFTKPVIAVVNGDAVGFGVSILTYCDVVLASDKATFCLPATKIGYIPEGGVTLTLPQVVGSSVASEMFLQGRRLTAEQACRCGLVSEVIWPQKLMNEAIPRLENIISQPLSAMEATKTMVRCNLWDKLKVHVERERRLICEHWLSAQCQSNIKNLLQTGWLYN